MRLADLKPFISMPGGPYQNLKFLCPACGKHEIGIEIWHGPHGIHDVGLKDADGKPTPIKLWHGEQGPYRDWDTLSITPSISMPPIPKHDCPGWHGFITNGEVA